MMNNPNRSFFFNYVKLIGKNGIIYKFGIDKFISYTMYAINWKIKNMKKQKNLKRNIKIINN